MEGEGISKYLNGISQEERIGIELLVSMMIIDDLEKQPLEDKEYLIRFYKKAKESTPHKELFGYVLETIVELEAEEGEENIKNCVLRFEKNYETIERWYKEQGGSSKIQVYSKN